MTDLDKHKYDTLAKQYDTTNLKKGCLINFVFVLLICCLIGILNTYKESLYYEHNQKVQQLRAKVYEYKKTDETNYKNALIELSRLTNTSVVVLEESFDKLFEQEKSNLLKQIVENYIENTTNTQIDTNMVVKEYFKNDKFEYKKALNKEFLEQKNKKLNRIIEEKLDETNPILFEKKKKIYVKTLFKNDVNKFNQALDELLGYEKFSLTEQPLPKNGIINMYLRDKDLLTFKIIPKYTSENDETTHYYIKLYDYDTNELKGTIFVRSGNYTDIQIPVGKYKVKYACGNHWYGQLKLFGHKTQYYEINYPFKFYRDIFMPEMKYEPILNFNLVTSSKITEKEF